jgi:16S rRNA G1207 methylase RsmC
VIGIAAAARGAKVHMVECDSRAVVLAKANLAENHLTGHVSLGATLADVPGNTYDIVLSNPPTHGGATMLRPLFAEMLRVCRAGGSVAIVVRERLNYEKWFDSPASVERIAQRNGFKVLRVAKNARR